MESIKEKFYVLKPKFPFREIFIHYPEAMTACKLRRLNKMTFKSLWLYNFISLWLCLLLAGSDPPLPDFTAAAHGI